MGATPGGSWGWMGFRWRAHLCCSRKGLLRAKARRQRRRHRAPPPPPLCTRRGEVSRSCTPQGIAPACVPWPFAAPACEGGTCEYRRARRSGTYAMDLYQVCVRAFATRQRPTGGGGGGGQAAAACQRFPPTATRPILRLPAHPASSWRVWRQGLALGVCVCVHNAKAAVEGGPAG